MTERAQEGEEGKHEEKGASNDNKSKQSKYGI
jgi:hypothetical protein